MHAAYEPFKDNALIFATAAALLRAGKLDDAITLCDYLLLRDPTRPEYWIAGGTARMQRGLLDEALVSFQVAEAGDEKNPVPVMLRGLCLVRQGKEVAGGIALRKAVALADARPGCEWLAASIREHLQGR